MYKATIEKIKESKIIVIVRGVAKEKLLPLAEAMYAGGIRLLECTYDASGRITDEEIAANIEMLSKHFVGRMLIGAGTVLTEKQVALTEAAGGKFIISPDTNVKVIKKTKELGLVSIPGAITPTEVAFAYREGADFVKLFPIDIYGGAKYIKALKAPLSNIPLLAVGGVNPDNMAEFLTAGALGIGIGSGVVDKKLVEAGEFSKITELAKSYTKQL